MLYKEITKCRVCWSTHLKTILDLWEQALTWFFPLPSEDIEKWPLAIVKCEWECWLLQLKYDYDLEKLYWDDYGYRSGLNKWMVKHLEWFVEKLKWMINLEKWDLIIDIASNDWTLLSAFWDNWYNLLWIDPTSKKFSSYYPNYVDYISDFFSSKAVKDYTDKKAKIITSICMFYDLPNPLEFVEQVKEVLTDDWIWLLEQSYMPSMVDALSYDTICHEHLEYYALRQIKWIMDKVWLRIIDVVLNDSNWWSFEVIVTKDRNRKANNDIINKLLKHEDEWWYTSWEIFGSFKNKIVEHKKSILSFFETAKKENKKVLWYWASTKWNVTLQYCWITKEMMPYIAEVNEYKFWRTTPWTNIPIISEQEAKQLHPDYYFVLPWHFKKWILEREQEFLNNWWHFVFPLPTLEIV